MTTSPTPEELAKAVIARANEPCSDLPLDVHDQGDADYLVEQTKAAPELAREVLSQAERIRELEAITKGHDMPDDQRLAYADTLDAKDIVDDVVERPTLFVASKIAVCRYARGLESRAETAERALAEAKADCEALGAQIAVMLTCQTTSREVPTLVWDTIKLNEVVRVLPESATAFLHAHTEALKNARTVGTCEICKLCADRNSISNNWWGKCLEPKCPIRAAKGA